MSDKVRGRLHDHILRGRCRQYNDNTHQTQINENGTTDEIHSVKEMEKDVPQAPPYTPLHEAVVARDLARVTELLQRLEELLSDESRQSTYNTPLLDG